MVSITTAAWISVGTMVFGYALCYYDNRKAIRAWYNLRGLF